MGLCVTGVLIAEVRPAWGQEQLEQTSDQPATTVEEWLRLAQAEVVQVTGIRVEPSDTGVKVILETVEGQLSPSTPSIIGDALIADFPNAVLALPNGEEFQITNPVAGIALITVTSRPDGIRLAITGLDAPPIAEVRTSGQALVVSVTAGVADTF